MQIGDSRIRRHYHIIFNDGKEVLLWSNIITPSRPLGLAYETVKKADYIADVDTFALLKSSEGRTGPITYIAAEEVEYSWLLENGYEHEPVPVVKLQTSAPLNFEPYYT